MALVNWHINGVNGGGVSTLVSASIGRNEGRRSAFLNHPSGDSTPSAEDWTFTTRLREAGDLLGIKLLDHLILGDDRLYSFADQGWPL